MSCWPPTVYQVLSVCPMAVRDHLEAGKHHQVRFCIHTGAAADIAGEGYETLSLGHEPDNTFVSAAQPSTASAVERVQGAGQADRIRRLSTVGDAATPDPMTGLAEQPNVGRASVPHDQPHWQDDYATNWDRVGMNRHASTSDAAASAVQQVSAMAALEESDTGIRAGKNRTWACKLCTFAENPSHSIRCEVCDTTRGSTLQDVQHTSLTSAARATGIGVLSTLQCAPPILMGEGRNTEPCSGLTSFAAQQSIAERLHQSSAPKPNRHKGSSKRSQQSISGFLDAGLAAKRSNQCTPVSSAAVIESTYTGQKWQCSKCKQWLHLSEQVEHNDYHLALDLHRQAVDSHAHRKTSDTVQACKATSR